MGFSCLSWTPAQSTNLNLCKFNPHRFRDLCILSLSPCINSTKVQACLDVIYPGRCASCLSLVWHFSSFILHGKYI
jgi:hypothetical protein